MKTLTNSNACYTPHKDPVYNIATKQLYHFSTQQQKKQAMPDHIRQLSIWAGQPPHNGSRSHIHLQTRTTHNSVTGRRMNTKHNKPPHPYSVSPLILFITLRILYSTFQSVFNIKTGESLIHNQNFLHPSSDQSTFTI